MGLRHGVRLSLYAGTRLVGHHFGSEEALREACDEHLMKTMRRVHARAETAPGSLNPPLLTPEEAAAARAALDRGQAT